MKSVVSYLTHLTHTIVIPAKAGIQYLIHGFRVKPGMTKRISLHIIPLMVLLTNTLVWAASPDKLIQSYKQQVAAQESKSIARKKSDTLDKFSQEMKELKKRWQALAAGSTRKTPSYFESPSVRKWLGADEQDILSQLKKSVTLDLLVACVMRENLEIQEARKQWEAVLEKFSQADHLDQILKQYRAFYSDLSKVVSEEFPFPTVTALKGDLALKEAEIARLNYQITLKKVIRQLEVTFYERIFLGQKDRIIFENIELLKSLEKSVFSQYNTAKAGYSNLIKINILLEKAKTDLKNNRQAEGTALADIRFLLNLPSEFSLGGFTPPPALQGKKLSMDTLYKRGVKNRQELELVRRKIEKTDIAITMAERKLFPSYRLPVQEAAWPLSSDEDKKAHKSPAAPKGVWFGTVDAYVREAKLNYQALQKRLESDTVKLRYQLERELERLENSNRDLELYRDKLIKLSDNDLKVSLKDYQGELAGFMDLLEAEKSLLKYQLAYEKSVKDNRQSEARLKELLGTYFSFRKKKSKQKKTNNQ